ncbi:MAG TPA: hypothetical protein VJV04_07435, partial [Nitrospiraceae bacterium]|nr:hypothetical protein [Nitrospiraceae bacterium]
MRFVTGGLLTKGIRMGPIGLLLLVVCSCVPVTNGFHAELPKRSMATIVWGDDLSAVGTATTWLLRQGLAVTERSLLAGALEMENRDVTHTLKDEAAILQIAQKMGVQEVVFVDRGGDDQAPMVSVRGVQVESNRVRWSGTARYDTFKMRPPKDTLADLTCQALATAWGLREPGTKWFTSSQAMCEIES